MPQPIYDLKKLSLAPSENRLNLNTIPTDNFLTKRSLNAVLIYSLNYQIIHSIMFKIVIKI